MSDAPVSTDASPVTSDTPSTGDGAGATPAVAPTTAAPATTEAETSVLDMELPGGMQQFDRSYVEKLRNEAAANRQKARDAEARAVEQATKLERFNAFDGYTDDDMQVWEQMASDWKTGNYNSAAETMQKIAQGVLGDPNATNAERAEAAEVLADPEAAARSLTEDQVREIARSEQAEMEAAAKREQAVQNIYAQIKDAGFEDQGPDANSILWYATQQTEGDIEAAIAKHKAYQQGIIDRYVESMASGGSPVRMPSGGAGGTQTAESPKNLQEARHAAQAWLDERRNAG